jgi:hypothetical protein
MEMFISTHELYMYTIVSKVEVALKSTYSNFAANYDQTTKVVFFVFLFFQAAALLILRRKLVAVMKQDVF